MAFSRTFSGLVRCCRQPLIALNTHARQQRHAVHPLHPQQHQLAGLHRPGCSVRLMASASASPSRAREQTATPRSVDTSARSKAAPGTPALASAHVRLPASSLLSNRWRISFGSASPSTQLYSTASATREASTTSGDKEHIPGRRMVPRRPAKPRSLSISDESLMSDIVEDANNKKSRASAADTFAAEPVHQTSVIISPFTTSFSVQRNFTHLYPGALMAFVWLFYCPQFQKLSSKGPYFLLTHMVLGLISLAVLLTMIIGFKINVFLLLEKAGLVDMIESAGIKYLGKDPKWLSDMVIAAVHSDDPPVVSGAGINLAAAAGKIQENISASLQSPEEDILEDRPESAAPYISGVTTMTSADPPPATTNPSTSSSTSTATSNASITDPPSTFSGQLMMAVILNKIFEPIRIAAAVALTPRVQRYLKPTWFGKSLEAGLVNMKKVLFPRKG